MGSGDIVLGDGEVAFEGFIGAVPHHLLEGVDVGVVAQVGDGEGMPKIMRGVDGDACTVADALDHVAEVVTVQPSTGAGAE